VFSGNDDLPGDNAAPSIRPRALRDDGWTVSNLAYALQSGITPSGDVFGGSMGEVVQNGTRYLTKADLTAMATYLLDNDLAGAEAEDLAGTEPQTDTETAEMPTEPEPDPAAEPEPYSAPDATQVAPEPHSDTD